MARSPSVLRRTGKLAELVVAEIERALYGTDAEIEQRVTFETSDGVKHEIDVVVTSSEPNRIKLGFECRDRQETSDVEWIATIAGKLPDVPLDKMFAVSTSRFSKHAIAKARRHKVTLLTLKQLEASLVKDKEAPKFHENFHASIEIAHAEVVFEVGGVPDDELEYLEHALGRPWDLLVYGPHYETPFKVPLARLLATQIPASSFEEALQKGGAILLPLRFQFFEAKDRLYFRAQRWWVAVVEMQVQLRFNVHHEKTPMQLWKLMHLDADQGHAPVLHARTEFQHGDVQGKIAVTKTATGRFEGRFTLQRTPGSSVQILAVKENLTTVYGLPSDAYKTEMLEIPDYVPPRKP